MEGLKQAKKQFILNKSVSEAEKRRINLARTECNTMLPFADRGSCSRDPFMTCNTQPNTSMEYRDLNQRSPHWDLCSSGGSDSAPCEVQVGSRGSHEKMPKDNVILGKLRDRHFVL
uniref:Uncharacterized protein n=1 Tax=Mesocestoides corti TaxID=53468 RepID=A0A5K3FQ57_MESCO